jgi:hypothetical protein
MARTSSPPDRFFLWVDAVGGYWVCLADAVVIGLAVPGSDADIPILGDLSPRHARLRRDGEGYLIEALREVRVEGKPVSGVAALQDGNRIQLGQGVQLAFRRPHALSATARLDLLSHHGTQPSVDAVILMADSLVLGPRADSHIVCPLWPHEVVLYRQQDQLYCRAASLLEIDGSKTKKQGPARLSANSRVVGDWFSLSLEGM